LKNVISKLGFKNIYNRNCRLKVGICRTVPVSKITRFCELEEL
jgi:hypothetical protein